MAFHFRRLYRIIILLALLCRPVLSATLAELQDSFITLHYGMFLHFNMGTFTGQEWASPGQDPSRFNPTQLNCGQWADAAKEAGMKYMTLTTKHHDGFCLWNSAAATYDVGSSSWRSGNGDVVREFVDSARSRGMKVCFYYSIWDKTNGSDTTFIKNQLTELLTNYGAITALWFDGWGWQIGYTAVPYDVIYRHIKSLQPDCLVLENNHRKSLSNTDIVLYERNVDGVPPADNTLPLEVCDNIRSDGSWFYNAGFCNLKYAESLHNSLHAINAGHGNYLLDLTPDTLGLLPACQVSRLMDMLTFTPDTMMFNQEAAAYKGTWSLSGNRGFGDYMDDLRFTRTDGDSFTFDFTGTGVDLISERNAEHGSFDIYVDGLFNASVPMDAAPGLRPAQQAVFTVSGLVSGAHRLKGVYTGGSSKYGVIDAFRRQVGTSGTRAEQDKTPLPQHSTAGMVVRSGSWIGSVGLFPAGDYRLCSVNGRQKAVLHSTGKGLWLPSLRTGIYFLKSNQNPGNHRMVAVVD